MTKDIVKQLARAVSWCAIGGIGLWVAWQMAKGPSNKPQSVVPNTHETAAASESVPAATSLSHSEPMPPSSGHSMHAIELLDRYDEVQGQLVTIDAWSIPNAFYGNQILQYARVPPKAAVMGRTVGVHFDREIRPGVLIYDVMAVDPHGDFMQGTDVRQVGQIAVQMSTPGIYPDVFQSWDVEPRGTLEGTTEGGLVVRIPLVRFWRYHDSGLDAGKPIQISIPPQPHGTPSDPHQDSAVIPLGPDALRFKVLGLHAGMKKTDAVEQLSHVAFQGIGCEEEGTDSEHCQYKSDSGEEVKAVYFRDELLHLDYKFPYSEFERIRVSLVASYGQPRLDSEQFGSFWGTDDGGAILHLTTAHDKAEASVSLGLNGRMSQEYAWQHNRDAQSRAAQSNR